MLSTFFVVSYLSVCLSDFIFVHVCHFTTAMHSIVNFVSTTKASDIGVNGREATTDGGHSLEEIMYFSWNLPVGLHIVRHYC